MKNTLNEIFNEARDNFNLIFRTYKILEMSYEMKISIHPAGQWILDNMYVIEQEYSVIKEEKKNLKNKRLPIIKASDGSKYISIYYLANELVEENKGAINQWLIEEKLREHQKFSYLSSLELNLFMLMLKIALLKFIARVSENILHSQLQKLVVEEILKNENIEFFNQDKKNFSKFTTIKDFREYMVDEEKIKNSNTAFIEYMAFRLKEYGKNGDKFLKHLKNEAEKSGFTVDSAIVKEHMEIAKTTDYIGKAIISYKQIQGINFREIFERVNKADETLKEDYTHEFEKCDYKTKNRYRGYIIKLAKRYNLSEIYVAKKAVECSKKYKKHVGYFLIGEEKWKLKKELGKAYIGDKIYLDVIKPMKSFLYIFTILFLAVIATLFINMKLINFDATWMKVMSYIITFVFSLEISEKTVCYVLRKLIKPKVLPRFDFAKTIDSKYPTYVVMPTIISSIEKLDQMISKMEITYLANRSENMYYMLIGDCLASDKKVIDIDSKIVEYAKEKLDELNKKYESDRVLFNFLYRKRVYSKSEGSYMGWERKRGALAQFNKLVLGKMSDKEKNDAMWLIYDDIIKTKYIITVDEDTSLSLNTAKDLVAIISHPLNKPVLAKNGKIIKDGYGLIQPSVSLDIESANKSIFSKIFGGFGGLDIYTTAVSNTYQDVFGEAIFCGKGIYDVEMFEKIVGSEIPENLVLSHDLLEGSLVRTGLASDIEVQDAFPNNYIAYMKRNHRWYRGDMQIIRWLLSPKSKLNLLSKWKIFDNLRRPLLDVFALIAIVLSAFISDKVFATTSLITFCVLNFGYIISIFNRLIMGKFAHTKELQYIPIIHGIQADLLSMCFNFVTIPYKAYMCLNAFITSLYRMLISHKKLLQWTTAETLEKTAKNTLSYYAFNMSVNIICGLALILIPYKNIEMQVMAPFKVIIGMSFILAPILSYLLGKDHLISRKRRLNTTQEEEVIEVAKRTWEFFNSMMTPTNNFLPTDNFQENRRYKIANRTSSTNVGFGILSIINAYDLKFISKDEAIKRLENIMQTVEKLEKWHGNLYNWYNIKTLEPLRPRFISTVDSGNFVACLYVLKEFLYTLNNRKDYSIRETKKDEDYDRIQKMIDKANEIIEETDFSVLYNQERNIFSIGYDEESGKLVDSYYDILMSESRLTSLISIARRQVTSKHWFSLSRNLVKTDGYKGLVSWSGTAFEYFMPYLFNKSYEHTLIDQSLFFAKYSQIKYVRANNMPWGISESAFAVKDNELNYQYQAFGIPWLGLKRGLNNFLVISPYASLLMLEFDPVSVYKNMKALKKIGAYSSYGFYEAIDYTAKHIEPDKEYEVVKTYMAHHQGMILTSINNYINHGIIKERFQSSPDIRACEILLKEREKMKANIKKNVLDTENVYKQKSQEKYTMFVEGINSKTREEENDNSLKINLLKGHNLSTIITSNGASFLKYRDKIVNKQRYTDVENSGNFIFLTDKVSGVTFLATSADDVKDPRIKKTWLNNMLNASQFYVETKELETTTTVYLSPEYNMEIKKVSIYNNSSTRREILINTYIEPAMTDYMTSVVHPSFSNLTIETYYDEDLDLLVASKRKKTEQDSDLFVYSKLIGIDLEKEVETEKSKIANTPELAYDNDVVKYPLWPVLSYRATIILDPHERQEFFYVVGVTESKYRMNNSIVNIDFNELEEQYKLTCELNNITSRYLELTPGKAALYNNIIKDVLFGKPEIKEEEFWNESMNQSMLWKYSISGDLPIMMVYINRIENAGIIEEVIKFMDYVKNRKIDLDIVVFIDEEDKDKKPLYHFVKSHLDRAVYMDYTKGNIYLLNINDLTHEELKLISFLSKKYIDSIDEFTNVEKYLQLSSDEEDTISADEN